MSLMIERRALELLEVRLQRLLELGRAARPRQRHLRAADQVGERRAQLVRDVGVEGLELLVGVLQPAERAVEGGREVGQLDRQVGQRQALRRRRRPQRLRVAREPLQRMQADAGRSSSRARSPAAIARQREQRPARSRKRAACARRAPNRRRRSAARPAGRRAAGCRATAVRKVLARPHGSAIVPRPSAPGSMLLDLRRDPCRTGSAGRRSSTQKRTLPSDGVRVSILACTRAQRSSAADPLDRVAQVLQVGVSSSSWWRDSSCCSTHVERRADQRGGRQRRRARTWLTSRAVIDSFIARPRSSSRSFHRVAHAADGVQQLGREGRVDLGPQPLDRDLDDIGVAVEVHVPDQLGDRGLGEDLALAPRQHREQRELLGRQVDARAAAPGLARDQVDLQVGDAQLRRLLAAAAPRPAPAGAPAARGTRTA